MIAAIGVLTLLGLGLGALLGIAARYLKVEGNPLVEKIDALLPGSQCGQCGYPGCSQLAAAMARGEAPLTLCPPGGRVLAEEIAAVLGVSLDRSTLQEQAPKVAVIHEALCIGCTKCLKRCPTDAILGANNMIHAVFADACTGCGNCVDICPTESIQLELVQPTLQTWHWPLPPLTSRARGQTARAQAARLAAAAEAA
jgi:electron transport complex protein RnfB